MSNDLISRIELIEDIKKWRGLDNRTCEIIVDTINNQPIAYDVDKVVKQILNVTVNLFAGRSNGKTLFAKTLSEYRRIVLDIVKEGGINDISNN